MYMYVYVLQVVDLLTALVRPVGEQTDARVRWVAFAEPLWRGSLQVHVLMSLQRSTSRRKGSYGSSRRRGSNPKRQEPTLLELKTIYEGPAGNASKRLLHKTVSSRSMHHLLTRTPVDIDLTPCPRAPRPL